MLPQLKNKQAKPTTASGRIRGQSAWLMLESEWIHWCILANPWQQMRNLRGLFGCLWYTTEAHHARSLHYSSLSKEREFWVLFRSNIPAEIASLHFVPAYFKKPRETSALKIPQTCKYHLLFNCNLNLYSLILVAVNGQVTCQVLILFLYYKNIICV